MSAPTPPLPRRFQLSKERFRPDTSRMEKRTRDATYYNPPEYARMLWHLDQLRPLTQKKDGLLMVRAMFRVILSHATIARAVDHARGRGVPR